jgi:trigger factor
LQEGDIATIDFEGFVDGEPIVGGKENDFDLEIGKGRFIEGFEQQLIGAKAGEEKDINVKFPEDYGEKALAGKDALFRVKVKRISIKELPEIDDEFAKDVSEFETLDLYKKDLKEKLFSREELRIKSKIEDEVISKVVGNATVDIPKVMIDRQVEQYLHSFYHRLQYQGMSMEQFFKNTGIDQQEFYNDMERDGEQHIKKSLVLEKIAEVENIEVTDEQLEEEIKRTAEMYKIEADNFKKQLRDEDIEAMKDNLRTRNTIDFLVNSVVEK